MENENQKKGKLEIWKGIGELGFGVLMLFLGSVGKDSWEYYFDADRRAIVDMAYWIGWGGLVLGVVGIIYGICLQASTAQTTSAPIASQKNGEIAELIEGEVVKKEVSAEHQLEWVTFRQKNGNILRVYHELSDHISYKVGDRGIVRTKDRKIVQYIPEEVNQDP